MTFEEVIARTNPPDDRAELLRQFEELRRKGPVIVTALERLTCTGRDCDLPL
jgi:hypothetical protein